MNAATLPPLGIDLSSATDNAYWGTIVSTGLLGVVLLQAWVYVNTNSDSWRLRSYVALVVALGCATTILTAEFWHSALIVRFGDVNTMVRLDRTVLAESIANSLGTLLVQIYIAQRIYLSTIPPRVTVSIFVGVTALLSFSAALYAVSLEWHTPTTATLKSKNLIISTIVEQALRVASDAVAATALTMDLLHELRTIPIRKTVTMLERVHGFVLARGSLVAAANVALIIIYSLGPANFKWAGFYFILSKLYAITFLALVNTRIWFQLEEAEEEVVGTMATGASFAFQVGVRSSLGNVQTFNYDRRSVETAPS